MPLYALPFCVRQDNCPQWVQPLRGVAPLGVAAHVAHVKSGAPGTTCMNPPHPEPYGFESAVRFWNPSSVRHGPRQNSSSSAPRFCSLGPASVFVLECGDSQSIPSGSHWDNLPLAKSSPTSTSCSAAMLNKAVTLCLFVFLFVSRLRLPGDPGSLYDIVNED
jgi:hypothetical protein